MDQILGLKRKQIQVLGPRQKRTKVLPQSKFLSSFPDEIWLLIWDSLDTPGIENFAEACHYSGDALLERVGYSILEGIGIQLASILSITKYRRLMSKLRPSLLKGNRPFTDGRAITIVSNALKLKTSEHFVAAISLRGLLVSEKFEEIFFNLALHAAMHLRDLGLAELALLRGASFNVLPKSLYSILDSPLHIAAIHSSEEIMMRLICRGADIKCKWKGHNPLYYASEANNLRVVQYLLRSGCPTRVEDGEPTAMHIATKKGHTEIVKELLKWDEANLDIIDQSVLHIDNFEGTPLHYAAIYGHTEIMDHFIEHEYGCFQVNKKGETLLHIAATYGRLEMIKSLLKAQLYDLDQRCNLGETPFHRAVLHGHKEAARLLIENGIDIDITIYGMGPLHLMALGGKSGIKWLIELGCDINAQDDRDRTPLTIALKKRNLFMVRELLDLGACIGSLEACMHRFRNSPSIIRLLSIAPS